MFFLDSIILYPSLLVYLLNTTRCVTLHPNSLHATTNSRPKLAICFRKRSSPPMIVLKPWWIDALIQGLPRNKGLLRWPSRKTFRSCFHLFSLLSIKNCTMKNFSYVSHICWSWRSKAEKHWCTGSGKDIGWRASWRPMAFNGGTMDAFHHEGTTTNVEALNGNEEEENGWKRGNNWWTKVCASSLVDWNGRSMLKISQEV